MATATAVRRKAPVGKTAAKAPTSPALSPKQKLQGLDQAVADSAPWWLVYDGVIVTASIFSGVCFDYVKKHERTADRYEVRKNPLFVTK